MRIKLSQSRRVQIAAAAAGLVVAVGAGRSFAGAPLTQVALSGQAAPAGAGGASYLEVGTPSLNTTGQVAFQAAVGDASATEPDFGISGIYLAQADGSGVSPVVRAGDASPSFLGFPAREFTATPAYILNDAGQVAFRAFTAEVGDTTGETQKTGLYIAQPGGVGIQPVTETGGFDVSADINERVGEIHEPFAFGASGDLAYSIDMVGPPGSAPEGGQSRHTVLVRQRPDGAHTQVAREAEPAPGNGAGVNFRSVGSPRVDVFGSVHFDAGIVGPGVIPGSNNHAFYFFDATRGGQLSRTFRNGQPINTNGPTLTTFNVTGTTGAPLAVASFLSGPGYGEDSDQVLLVGGHQDFVDIVAREGDQAPGAGGAVYAGMTGMAVTAYGNVAYVGYLKGTDVVAGQNDVALFGGLFPAPQMILRSGSQAPGMLPGAAIWSVDTFALNQVGQMMFLATVDTDPSAEQSFAPTLYTYDPTGGVSLVAAFGEQVEVAPGELRSITGIGFEHLGSGVEGLSSSFNDAGKLAFLLSFADGSRGIYTAEVAVPEPAMIGAIAALASVVIRPRRGRRHLPAAV